MTKIAVVKQFFMDFIENLGYHVSGYEEFEEEECNMIISDLFFAGRLKMKWNPKAETLMLKPTIVINVKRKTNKRTIRPRM